LWNELLRMLGSKDENSWTKRGQNVSSMDRDAGLRSGRADRKVAGGLAGWLIAGCARWLGRLRRSESNRPRLELVERITLAPKQSLALVEAEGRRLLVAISPDGSPAFFALDNNSASRVSPRANPVCRVPSRVSW
jgi:hypothetical protein